MAENPGWFKPGADAYWEWQINQTLKAMAEVEARMAAWKHEIERFWAFVSPEPTSGCWIWTGGLQSKGYGFFCRADASMVLAHRYMFELERGPIAPGMQLDHVCCMKWCVNPAHLDQVTGAENMLRRYRAARGEPIRGAA